MYIAELGDVVKKCFLKLLTVEWKGATYATMIKFSNSRLLSEANKPLAYISWNVNPSFRSPTRNMNASSDEIVSFGD